MTAAREGFGGGSAGGTGNRADLVIEGGRRVFAPGDEVAGSVSWHLEEDPESVVLRLYWRTEGRGTQDTDTEAEEVFRSPGLRDERDFSFRLPEGPYSFSGTLISLVWGLELVAEPQGALGNLDIVVSHGPGEVVLTSVDPQAGEGGEGGSREAADGGSFGEKARRFKLPKPPSGWGDE